MRHRLHNGLTVLVEENHAAPVTALQVWVRVGSADELSHQAGLAHLHEHMLFKGTARRGPGEIARTIEASGGEINAWTSFDQTVYHVVVASQFTAQGLDVLADAITQAAFDPKELTREIEVVCEEIKRSLDSPARKLSKELFAAAYTRHPYGKPVIGTEESVRSFTRDGILSFYRRWYRPENCVVVAVGDVREEEILELAQRNFAWPAAAFEPAPERPAEAPRNAPKAKVVRDRLKEGYLSIAWPAPALRDPDVAALDALAIVLGHGEASRLFRALKRDRLLCTDVQASCYTPADPGLTIVGLTLRPEQVDEAVREALRQVYRTRAAEVTDEELSLACRLIESEAVYQRETVQGQARKLGFYESSAGGLEFEAEYLARVAALTPRIVREAAERHLPTEATIACAILPEGDGIDSDGLSALLAEAGEAALKSPRTAPSPRTPEKREPIRFAEPRTGPLAREQLAGGGVLLVKEERAVPLVALRAVWPGGLRAETETDCGINMLLARLAAKGTRLRGPEELAREFEAMGGAIGGNSGRNSFGLRAELLSRHFARGFELFAECIAQPVFADAEVERERKIQLDEVRSREDNPAGVAFQLLSETLYRQHPYRFDTLGSEDSISRLGAAELASYRERRYAPGRPVLSVVGDVDPSEVKKLADRYFGAYRDGAALPLQPPEEPRPTAPRRAVRTLAKAQAHLVLGFLGARLSDPLRWPLEVLSTVLSGQGGRLFVELRDKRSLAYSVTSFSMEGVDPGAFAVYIGCGPEKISEALEGIRRELDRCRQSPPTSTELDRARTHLIGTHAISLQRNSARAAVYAFDETYGLGADFSSRIAEHVGSVSGADILAAAQQVLDPRGEVLALVGPEGAVPPELS